jgi:hypothetical protein
MGTAYSSYDSYSDYSVTARVDYQPYYLGPSFDFWWGGRSVRARFSQTFLFGSTRVWMPVTAGVVVLF